MKNVVILIFSLVLLFIAATHSMSFELTDGYCSFPEYLWKSDSKKNLFKTFKNEKDAGNQDSFIKDILKDRKNKHNFKTIHSENEIRTKNKRLIKMPKYHHQTIKANIGERSIRFKFKRNSDFSKETSNVFSPSTHEHFIFDENPHHSTSFYNLKLSHLNSNHKTSFNQHHTYKVFGKDAGKGAITQPDYKPLKINKSLHEFDWTHKSTNQSNFEQHNFQKNDHKAFKHLHKIWTSRTEYVPTLPTPTSRRRPLYYFEPNFVSTFVWNRRRILKFFRTYLILTDFLHASCVDNDDEKEANFQNVDMTGIISR